REWRARDPIELVASKLAQRGILTAEQIEQTAAAAKDLMAEIGAVLVELVPDGKPGQRRIKPEEWPQSTFVDVGVRGDLSEVDGVDTVDVHTFTGAVGGVKFIDAVAAVMR